MTRDDDQDADVIPLFGYATLFDGLVGDEVMADPNCPQCLRQLTLQGKGEHTVFACPDPECGMTTLL